MNTIIRMALFSVCASLLMTSGRMAAASITPIDDAQCQNMKDHGTMPDTNSDTPDSEKPPVGCNRLRNVHFQHIDFKGNTHTGILVVLDVIAESTQSIFDQLYAMRFPIAQAMPMEHFDGNDDHAMEANNTSAFNGRRIAGSTSWSKHAYGVAIDLNPLQNPVLYPGKNGTIIVKPLAATGTYINRLDARPGKAARPGMAEQVIDLFAQHGFIHWGGYWDSPMDIQHFEVGTVNFVRTLASKPLEQGKIIFEKYIEDYKQCIYGKKEEDKARDRAECINRISN
ncbi:M15 family metallopeptidase [Haematospirillum sp. H1815]|uniref:M15 family metallopeptidase n=1 Tax=Haematospirillum sp. H1815 TaxID=2723108 RepID=UPI00143A0BD6|nr:M15 family metallopeptidase [Haematospirillum sp. H1815]NKD76161.1 M15 family metallopeptidase [Haematospirillum sp. H1815]